MKQLLLVIGLLSASAFQSGLAADEPPPPAQATSGAPQGASASGTAAAQSGVKSSGDTASGDKAGAKPPDAAPARASAQGSTRVQVVTSLGSFTVELLPERAPLTVTQFLKYVDQGHYSGTIIHRVIPNFIIQGGGFDADFKIKGTPSKVVNESGNGLTNQRGTVGLARPPEPHGGDVQFYVNLFDNASLDPNQTRWGYAVFGKVVQGMDVVDRIGNVATGAKGPFKEDAPLTPVLIQRIERVNAP
jgi:peptidyl-prolyl cis-trans isomerase A (cyclophilin A)/peptidyl-prolyl cis-trans isomerase B (cyclophilin B)